MSEREDYAEPGAPPLWERPAVRWRVLKVGIIALLLVVLVGLPLTLYLLTETTDRYMCIHSAIARAETLVSMCEVYRRHHPDQIYPAKLSDLKDPPANAFPPYQGSDFTDLCGTPFRYALVPNAAGQMEPHIWAERTINGKTTLHGAKLAADGTVVRFGLPED